MITIDHLSKSYSDFTLKLSMTIPQGRVVGIVGRNGAGKSTTIKSILGLVQPDSGSVTLFGTPAESLTGADKERIGVAFAESGFSGVLTVKAINHILQNSYSRYDEGFFLRQVKEQQLPLNKPIKEFSTGMKAKLRVLVAMSHQAELLILDEPTAGLDILARTDILDLIRQYMAEDEHRSLVMTSHISGDLEGICDEIYLIHNGEILLHEDTDVLLDRYAVLKLSASQYDSLDKRYLLHTKPTSYGYDCLTRERQFYAENYPNLVIEQGGIDELIVSLASDERSE